MRNIEWICVKSGSQKKFIKDHIKDNIKGKSDKEASTSAKKFLLQEQNAIQNTILFSY